MNVIPTNAFIPLRILDVYHNSNKLGENGLYTKRQDRIDRKLEQRTEKRHVIVIVVIVDDNDNVRH